MNSINLGDEVRDVITGFGGVAVARHKYLQGCDRISVQPVMGEKGEVPDSLSFDEPQLIVTKAQKIKPVITDETRGGPERFMPQDKVT